MEIYLHDAWLNSTLIDMNGEPLSVKRALDFLKKIIATIFFNYDSQHETHLEHAVCRIISVSTWRSFETKWGSKRLPRLELYGLHFFLGIDFNDRQLWETKHPYMKNFQSKLKVLKTKNGSEYIIPGSHIDPLNQRPKERPILSPEKKAFL